MKKIFYVLLITILLFWSTPIYALDAPTPPPAPTAPSAPTAPTPPPTPSQTSNNPEPSVSPSASPSPSSSPTTSTDSSSPSSSPQNGPQSADTGTNLIQTGDSTVSANSTTLGNNNLSAPTDNTTGTSSNGTQVANINNGSGSLNNSSLNSQSQDTTVQNNSAIVNNNLQQVSTTGQNTTSDNVGDSAIKSGDANMTGTVVSALNTNIDGVAVSEFNIADDHQGDIILSFANGCISGCSNLSPVSVANLENGSDSNNNIDLNQLNNEATFQNNDATLGSTLTLSANSGNNLANRNTGGDSFIETGDANVAGNVLSFLNNNIAGNVVFGVVNIFGNLVGDIILPQSSIDNIGCLDCQGKTNLSNINNGTKSQNNISSNSVDNNLVNQNNNAYIDNSESFSATSGDNEVSQNTGSSSYVKTGNSTIDSNTLNIANSNISGGDWWLVIINKAGQWVGKIIGAPDGSSMAGSSGTEFQVGENGEITAVNQGNGADSINNITLNQQSDNQIYQQNNAKLSNNLNLSANTGSNQASNNTGGDSVIKTGDAKIIANLVNFVNNNIVGRGKLVVTMVNVFGSWFGDFVSPGQHKDNPSSPTPSPTPVADQNQASPLPSSAPASSDNQPSSSPEFSNDSDGNVVVQSSSGGSSSTSGPSVPTQVAGFSTSVGVDLPFLPSSGKGKDKDNSLRINLAWLIIALPLLGLSAVAIRRLKQKSPNPFPRLF